MNDTAAILFQISISAIYLFVQQLTPEHDDVSPLGLRGYLDYKHVHLHLHFILANLTEVYSDDYFCFPGFSIRHLIIYATVHLRK